MTDTSTLHSHIYRRGIDDDGEYQLCQCGHKVPTPHSESLRGPRLARLLRGYAEAYYSKTGEDIFKRFTEIERYITNHSLQEQLKVDRFEVIDETGRAYVKGSIYGSPISIKMDYQDNGRTLKVFVEAERKKL